MWTQVRPRLFRGTKYGSGFSGACVATDIYFEPRVEDDLEAIVDFLGATWAAAVTFANRLDHGITQLLRFPESAPAEPDGIRWLYLRGTRYFIV